MSSALYNTSSTHMFLTSWKALQVKIIITWSWFRTSSHWESVGFCERNYSRVPAAGWETRHASFKWSASVALRKLCRAAEHGVLSISSYHLGLWAVNLNSTVCCVEKNEMVDCRVRPFWFTKLDHISVCSDTGDTVPLACRITESKHPSLLMTESDIAWIRWVLALLLGLLRLGIKAKVYKWQRLIFLVSLEWIFCL